MKIIFRGVFTFTNFSMLNNYFPRRFHFFDFSHVPNAYITRNNHIYMIFGFRGIFTFANFSMLNNYFPRRFHFFDFFYVHKIIFEAFLLLRIFLCYIIIFRGVFTFLTFPMSPMPILLETTTFLRFLVSEAFLLLQIFLC